jgi:hypothetical protein
MRYNYQISTRTVHKLSLIDLAEQQDLPSCTVLKVAAISGRRHTFNLLLETVLLLRYPSSLSHSITYHCTLVSTQTRPADSMWSEADCPRGQLAQGFLSCLSTLSHFSLNKDAGHEFSDRSRKWSIMTYYFLAFGVTKVRLRLSESPMALISLFHVHGHCIRNLHPMSSKQLVS